MRITAELRQVFERRYPELAVAQGRTHLKRSRRLALWCALAGIIALSLTAPASMAVAGEAKSVYKPRVIGTGRHHRPGIGIGQVPRTAAAECPTCDPVRRFKAEDFSNPTVIDNLWLPLIPGTRLILQGQANRGGGALDHQVIFTVTDLVKEIDGVPCVVVWDQDINEGELVESELAFFAQDIHGNVWNTGEYPEEYESGEFVTAENTWIHGIDDAEAGVMVRRKPKEGSLGYQQGRAPGSDFWDCGMVDSRNWDKICVPSGCYKNTLTIREWAPLDGCEVIQLKTYSKEVGVVQVGALDDPEGETLVLVKRKTLSSRGLARARKEALKLDAHGYLVNEVYAQTKPAKRARPDDDGDDDDDRDAAQIASAPITRPHVFMSVSPNPVTTSSAIAYGIVEKGPVEIGIFDVAGRRIKSLVNEIESAGNYRVQWDGRDDGGNSVARGVYFARLRTNAEVVRKTLVVAR